MRCPLCNRDGARLVPYAYADYETGYRDEGYRLICECGVFEACEVDRLHAVGARPGGQKK
jgi:hypothetical protein